MKHPVTIAVPSYQVEDEEGRIHLLIHLAIGENEHRWCLWRPDHAGFVARFIFGAAHAELAVVRLKPQARSLLRGHQILDAANEPRSIRQSEQVT